MIENKFGIVLDFLVENFNKEHIRQQWWRVVKCWASISRKMVREEVKKRPALLWVLSLMRTCVKQVKTLAKDMRRNPWKFEPWEMKHFREDGIIPIDRILLFGIEEFDYLNTFIQKMKDAGTNTFILHARKAVLTGLSPKQNLNIPKLNYNMVYDIKRENPDLEIIINGGITKTKEIHHHLKFCDGVMIGRSIYQNPYSLIEIEKEIFKTLDNPSREKVAEKLLEYLDKEVKLGTKVNHIMRHTVGLYHGQIGSKEWKRYLSDNMMARDSDFQKAKHIMTIVQNNEKAIQANS